MLGMVVGGVGYAGFALATEGWMMFAWLMSWLLGALVTPSIQALMTRRVAENAQGELQGAVASLHGLSAVVAPPVMTQLFRRFTAPGAPIHFPGAAFLLATLLAVGALILFGNGSRSEG